MTCMAYAMTRYFYAMREIAERAYRLFSKIASNMAYATSFSTRIRGGMDFGIELK